MSPVGRRGLPVSAWACCRMAVAVLGQRQPAQGPRCRHANLRIGMIEQLHETISRLLLAKGPGDHGGLLESTRFVGRQLGQYCGPDGDGEAVDLSESNERVADKRATSGCGSSRSGPRRATASGVAVFARARTAR